MSSKRNVCIIGNFGYASNDLNGQTMRTRTVLESVEKYMDEYTIDYLDTSLLKRNSLSIEWLNCLVRAIFHVLRSKILIFMPAQGAIKYMCFLMHICGVILSKKVHFVAIGGWLYEFLSKNPRYSKYIKKADRVYVQTNSLKARLDEIPLDNVILFPNYRIYKHKIYGVVKTNKVYKVVFYSRVIREKGVEYAIRAIEELNNKHGYGLHLDIYGPIGSSYTESFYRLVNLSKTVSYKGKLDPDNILITLSQYHVLLFPTFYEGEGFPGVLLDAMTAGLPVISSDWKYNSEIIKDNFHGKIFEAMNYHDMIEKLESVINHPELIEFYSENCLVESERYSEERVVNILIEKLKI